MEDQSVAKTSTAKEPPQRALMTRRTDRHGVVLHGLELFKLVAAAVADVIVGRHGSLG